MHGTAYQTGRAISIHAPAQGATILGRILALPRFRFQSTPPRRGRLNIREGLSRRSNFNPRPRAGGDTSGTASNYAAPYFNPRPRAGGDCINAGLSCTRAYFNPRPRAGGDAPTVGPASSGRIFQSTPPRRGRRLTSCPFDGGGSRGRRPRAGGDPISSSCSISRSGRGRRPRAGGDHQHPLHQQLPEAGGDAPAQGATMIARISFTNPLMQGATAKPAYILTYTLLFLHKLHLSLVFFFSASFKFMQKQASVSVRIRLCFHERLYLAHHTISTSSG